MHSWQHDPSLEVPATSFDAAGGPLPFDMAPLRRPTAPAGSANIGGRCAEAWISANGADRVIVDGIEVMRQLHVVDMQPRADVVTSIGLERTLTTGVDDVTLRFMVLPDIAAFTAEFTAAVPQSVTVEWLHYANTSMRWNTDHSTIMLAGTGGTLCIAFAGTRVEWNIEPVEIRDASILRVRARFAASPAGVLLHATSSRLSTTIAPTLRSLNNAAGSARAFIGAQRRRMVQGIALESPDCALDAALAWAVQSIAVPRPFAAGSAQHSHPALHALAASASGSPGIARGIIASLHGDDPFLPLLIARYHAWTADSAFVVTQWQRTQAAVAHLIDTHMGAAAAGTDSPAAVALAITALSEIAATAGDIGRSVMTAAMQAQVGAYRNDHADVVRNAHWIDALPDAGADALQCARGDVGGYATHSPAAVIADVAYGLFGIEPEAARNRIRLRICLPADWRAASVRGIQVGDAVISMRYARTSDQATGHVTHRFEAVQDSGPGPIRLILEPMIEATRFHRATVDGVDARLDVRAAGRLMIPVQVVLDDARVIELFTDGGPAGR